MTTGGHHDDGAKGAPAYVDDSKKSVQYERYQ